MIYGSVCSGIEAATVAWHPLGWRPAFFSEIDKFPRAVLAHHYPEIPCHGDFTTIQAGDYQSIDLLVGGTPCQDFSVAGLRAGLAGERGRLTIEFLELARRLRPKWLVWENVPGVLSADGGAAFALFLGRLGQLGYGFSYRVLDAQHFGVPQRRRRVFVVGHLGDWRRAAAVLFERQCLSWHPAPRREAGQGVAGTLGGSSQSGGFRTTDLDNNGAFIAEVAPTLRAGGNQTGGDRPPGTDVDTVESLIAFSTKDYGQDAGALAPTLRAGGFDKSHANGGVMPAVAYALQERAICENPAAGPDGAGFREGEAYTLEARQTPQAVAFAMRGREGGAMPELSGDGVSALRAASGGSTRDMVAFNARQDTSVGGVFDPLGAQDTGHGLMIGSAVRRLTPRECERLQGFPDDFTLVPYRKKPSADGPRYKALGNSMAVPVMRWIGERIARVEAMT